MTWDSSWNVRSALRKSGMFRLASAFTTPTRVTPGKSCPLAIIWVPIRISAEQPVVAALAGGRVAVHTHNPRRRQQFPQVTFNPLGAGTQVLHLQRAAGRTDAGGRDGIIAVVADALASLAVEGQRH